MIDNMSKSLKAFCYQVKSFYKDELVYHTQHMPKPGDYNQVYFPWCNHILDVQGLMQYLNTLEVNDQLFEWLDICLFNKDKELIFSLLTKQQ